MAGNKRKSTATKKVKEPEKATFSLRAAAFIVDILLFAIVWSIVTDYISINARIGRDPFYVFLLLSALIVGIYQTTPGKRLFNLKIVAVDAERVSMLRALLRETLGKLASSFIFGIGFLWMIIDKKNQTLHDKLARTNVVINRPVGKLRKVAAYLIVIATAFIFLFLLVVIYLVRSFI